MNITNYDFSENMDNLTIQKCSKKKCNKIEINEPELIIDKQLVNSLLADPIKKICFDDVCIMFNIKKYNDVLGPNIDTISICYSIKENKNMLKNINSFIEIGVGSGFITKYICSKFNINKAYLNDINKSAIKYCIDELELPVLKYEKKTKQYYYKNDTSYEITNLNGYSFFRGDGIIFLQTLKTKVDLLVCNPPYIPKNNKLIDFNKNDINWFEGTNLLRYLILNYQLYANNLIINFSSTSLLNDDTINCLKQKQFKLLYSHKVPLKIDNSKGLFNKKKYDFLTSVNKNITINKQVFHIGAIKSNDLYPLYHIIYIVYF